MTCKKLNVDPLKCDGCGLCEAACARVHNTDNLEKSRIRVLPGGEDEGFYLPTTCQHCENPPCMAVCPEEAIFRHPDIDGVMIEKKRCIGCRMCVSACPFGAVGFDSERGFAFKCDLCNGEPECVLACGLGALEYLDGNILNYTKMRESANRHHAVSRH